MTPNSDGERLLNVRELAAYMQVSERTVLRLAAGGSLPAAKIGLEWRFQRAAVDAWLSERTAGAGDGVGELADIQDAAHLPLSEILDEKGVVGELGVKDHDSAIEALAARASSAGWIHDKAWLVQAVAAREHLSSTAMEGGVAFLHTRER